VQDLRNDGTRNGGSGRHGDPVPPARAKSSYGGSRARAAPRLRATIPASISLDVYMTAPDDPRLAGGRQRALVIRSRSWAVVFMFLRSRRAPPWCAGRGRVPQFGTLGSCISPGFTLDNCRSWRSPSRTGFRRGRRGGGAGERVAHVEAACRRLQAGAAGGAEVGFTVLTMSCR